MHAIWSQFLSAAGALQADDDLLDFARAAKVSEGKGRLMLLADLATIKVTGEDATNFLQGQFSNDIESLAQPGSQLSTWSTPKGRVLALFRISRVGSDYFLTLPTELAATFVKRLRMYVLMAKVQVELLRDHGCFAASGVAVQTVLQQRGIHLQEPGDVAHQAGLIVSRVRGDQPRFEISGPAEALCELWTALAVNSTVTSRSDWNLQNIEAGLPSVRQATSEAFVLQMLNLQVIDGVSFKKGCFPGQEVVARMQYLGKLKRRMYRVCLTSEAPSPVAVGDDVYRVGGKSAVGKVVEVAPVRDGVWHLLAVLTIDAAADVLQIVQSAGDEAGTAAVDVQLSVLDLPYTLEAG